VAVRLWSAGTIHKARQVTVAGPYAWVRHPLYVGSFLIACGYFLMSGRWQAFAVGIPVFVLLHWAAVHIEEAMLLALFGDEYAHYRRRVPQVLPYRRPQWMEASFSWDRVLYNREPLHILGVVVMAGLFALRMVLSR
jgi:hypothetical protein